MAPEKAIIWGWTLTTKCQYHPCGHKRIFLTSNRLNHSSVREVTAIQLLLRRLSLSSTRLSFPFITVFKFSPKSPMLLRLPWRFSISFRVAYRKQNKTVKIQKIKNSPHQEDQTTCKLILKNTLLLPITRGNVLWRVSKK